MFITIIICFFIAIVGLTIAALRAERIITEWRVENSGPIRISTFMKRFIGVY